MSLGGPRWIEAVATGPAVATVCAGALLAVLGLAGCGPVAGRAVPEAGAVAAHAFLSAYVDGDGDGRVVRRDQGGDTVSEGQADALLVAVGVGDRTTFAAVWRWTQQHLLRPDGTLSWRWADGHVVSTGPPPPTPTSTRPVRWSWRGRASAIST